MKTSDKQRMDWLNGLESVFWNMCTPECVKKFGHNKYDGEYRFIGTKEYAPYPRGRFDYYVGPLRRAVDEAMNAERGE